MGLPISVCPTDTVELPSGAKASIRGLSRAEALLCRAKMPDIAAVEVLTLSFTFDVTEAEAAAWHAKAHNDDVAVLMNAVAKLSGLSAAEGKADAED